MTEDIEDGSFVASRDSYAQSECNMYCIISSIMYIAYPIKKSRALLYPCFRKINHLVSITNSIHPLMYVKPCQEQFIFSGTPEHRQPMDNEMRTAVRTKEATGRKKD